MSTTCIPQDHRIHREAIGYINQVFAESQVIMVCDSDIMMTDISILTLKIQESPLSILLVCDCNVKAWTFQESTRGRRNVNLFL